MKLRSAYLQAFGKFVDTNISFSPTINLIYGDNESGKSTLAEFVFNMLYGQKKYGVLKRIYLPSKSRYLPWYHSLYQGILQYSLENREYKIERNFHTNFEEVKVYDEKVGQEITQLYHNDARKELQFLAEQIGLNERNFKNTVYVAQDEVEGLLHQNKESIFEELVGKVLYGVDGDEGEKTIREVIKELEKKKKQIGTPNSKNKPLGNSFETLRERLNHKYALENEMKIYNENQQSLNNILIELEEMTKKKEQIEAQKNYLDMKILEKKIDTIEKLVGEKQDLIQYIQGSFPSNIQQNSTEEVYRKRSDAMKKGKKSLSLVFCMIAIVVLLLIWTTLYTHLWLQIPMIGAAIVLGVRGTLKWKITLINEQDFFDQLEKANQYQDASNELKRLQHNIEDETKEYSLQQIKEKFIQLEQKNSILISDNSFHKYDLEIELEEWKMKEAELTNKKTIFQTKIQEQKWEPLELEEIERDIYNQKKTIENFEENIQAIDIAISTLESLEKGEKTRWLPNIIKKTEKNIYKITKKYHTIKIDDNYQIKTLEPNTQKLISIEQLSQGTFNQFYFAIRISLIQALSPRPIHLPIIVDEPFAHFDNQRFKESMELLKELSKKHQIIIFSSQGREKAYLDQNKCNYNYIELEKN